VLAVPTLSLRLCVVVLNTTQATLLTAAEKNATRFIMMCMFQVMPSGVQDFSVLRHL
jgi:hypothetical protein